MNLINVKEAASKYGYCEEQIRRLVREGKLTNYNPCKGKGCYIFLDADDCDWYFLKERMMEPTTKEVVLQKLVAMRQEIDSLLDILR